MRVAKLLCAVLLACLLSACGGGKGSTPVQSGGGGTPPPPPVVPFWSQWANNAEHTGNVAVIGQDLDNIFASTTVDPFVSMEQAENAGELTVHYQVPLLDSNSNIYMTSMTGTYTPCNPPGSGIPAPCGPDSWNTKVWNEQLLQMKNGAFSAVWTFTSDWKPEPNQSLSTNGAAGLGGWEPVFQPALANGFIYVPGFGGTIYKVDKAKGTMTSQINPFGTVDPNTFVAGPLTADSSGNIYYNALKLADPATNDVWGKADAVGSWLVKVDSNDVATMVSFSTLVSNPPTTCVTQFSQFINPLPWPPSPTAMPPSAACGSQRPGLNIAPGIGADGTIYTLSRAHFNDRYSYLIAVNPDLTPKWASSLRGLIADGCGVLIPIGTSLDPPTQDACREGTPPSGVDPETNDLPAARVQDDETSSPVVLPDGSLVLGTFSRYNVFRGHTMKFDSTGKFLAAFDFGWDTTPAVWSHDSTYSILLKDNHYNGEVGSYCNDPKVCPSNGIPLGPFYMTQLDSNLNVQWQFQNTNNQVCERESDGTINCVTDPDHPNGYEWCVNAPVVDKNGVVYALSEDGFVYNMIQGKTGVYSTINQRLFQNLVRGSAYTPLAVGPDGTIYTQNAGVLYGTGK